MVESNVYFTFFACWWKDSVQKMTDTDPGGPKTYGSGSTLLVTDQLTDLEKKGVFWGGSESVNWIPYRTWAPVLLRIHLQKVSTRTDHLLKWEVPVVHSIFDPDSLNLDPGFLWILIWIPDPFQGFWCLKILKHMQYSSSFSYMRSLQKTWNLYTSLLFLRQFCFPLIRIHRPDWIWIRSTSVTQAWLLQWPELSHAWYTNYGHLLLLPALSPSFLYTCRYLKSQ